MTVRTRTTPWFLMPFVWLWDLVTFIIGLTGRLLAVVLGVVLLIVGILLTLTIIGAIVGIPLFVLGLALIARGLF
ncbi:MAG TPA: hypothetical protein VFD70_20175 [Anaerolineae bacterium]|nr:hypothetical protein [Anaerolineae bacterium]